MSKKKKLVKPDNHAAEAQERIRQSNAAGRHGHKPKRTDVERQALEQEKLDNAG